MTTIRTTHLAKASTGSDALAPPGSFGKVSYRHREDDFHVAYWNIRTLQDVSVQALTMRELRKYNVDIACLSEVRIPDSGHSEIKVPCEEACYHLYHSGVEDNTGRQYRGNRSQRGRTSCTLGVGTNLTLSC